MKKGQIYKHYKDDVFIICTEDISKAQFAGVIIKSPDEEEIGSYSMWWATERFKLSSLEETLKA